MILRTMILRTMVLLLALLCFQAEGFAGEDLAQLQKDWAIATYQLEGDEQEAKFEALIDRADAAVEKNPMDPELLIWQGIIKSTWAGKTGGFSALGLVKDARESFERAMKLDDRALDGSAYTSLGALYYQVPGWPIAFGSDKKARELLQQAVRINPDGIDSNYFFGEFLFEEKEYARAKERLERALGAPPRPGRELADSGRREEIRALLARVNEQLES